MLRWITIVLSLCGLGVALYAVAGAKEPDKVLPLARPASVNPFEMGVASLGIVEPSGRDVGIVAPEAGLVTKVLVDVGQSVEANQVLFELDRRTLEADLLRAEASVAQAESEIERWHALPRAEDRPPLQARVARAQSLLEDAEDRLRLTEEGAKRQANNARDVSIARFARDAAAADVSQAQADLARLEAGGWKPDLDVTISQRDARKAEVAALKVLMDRLTVRAPRAGTILRRSIEAGEFATTSPQQPALILGDLSRLSIRAQVDEEDIALVTRAGSSLQAIARRRGGITTEFPLRLVRIEPFARPKTDLTGANVERVDTRVVDVLLEVLPASSDQPGHDVPLVPGQAVDVFLRTGGA